MPTVKELREKRGWTQQDLSIETGLSVGTISRVENGGDVNKATMKALCQALGVQTSEVTGVNVVNRVSKNVQ